jgi:hypothetical protein
MRPIEKTSDDLFQKLRSRFSPITLGDDKAETTAEPTSARIFNFMYKEGEKDVGYVSISLNDNRSLKVYYGSDLLENLKDKNSWYGFLRDLRSFAKRNLMAFDARDLAKNQLEPRDFKFISQQDGSYKDHEVEVTESAMFGSRRKSYQTVESVKMIVNHRKSIDETIPGARSRYIESIFIENADGERFKFPYNYLTGARAMTRHVAEGGTPYDGVGKHILETIKEMRDLSKFARRTKKYAMENAEAGTVREQVIERFQGLKKTLGALSMKEGYARFVENFKTEETLAEDDSIQQLKERFTQQVFDTQLEDTLPAVMRALKEAEMKKMYEADGSVEKLIKNPNWMLVLRKDDAADNLFKSTKFTDGQGLLGFILSDIASRAIGDNVDSLANFASDAAERVQDRDYDAKDKQLAMMLAKKYMDDVKKMSSDPSYADQVRMDSKNVYGAKKKREGGFHESDAFESWATELVPEDYDTGARTISKAAKASGQRARKPSKKGAMTKMANKYANKAVTGMDADQLPEDYDGNAARQAKDTDAALDKHAGSANHFVWSTWYKKNQKLKNKAVTGMDSEELPESSFYRDGERTGSAEGAKRAILWRIQNQHLDLIKQYGLDKVLQAVDDEAMYLDNLEEIGSSDISAWVNNIKRNLAADYPDSTGDKKKVGESQLTENWSDKDAYRFEDFKKKLEAKGYEIEGIMHWGYSDWRSSGDEPPHAELTIRDPKTGKTGSAYWPKGAKQKYFSGTNEATTQGTIGTTGTSGTGAPAGNQGQFIRDPKLQQGAKNISRVAQAAGIKAPPQQIAQNMAAQAAGKKPSQQAMQTVGGLGNTIMQAAASDPQKAAQLATMMKRMVTQGKFDEDAVKSILSPNPKIK